MMLIAAAPSCVL